MKAWSALISMLIFSTSFAEQAAKPEVLPLYSTSTPTEALTDTTIEPLTQFIELVQRQDWDRASILGNEILIEYEGMPRFDLYYGLLLIEERAYDLAIFPLERVLQLQPDQHRARLELGRAYFFLSNYKRAKKELLQVKAIEPPANVEAKIDDFLKAIDQAERNQEVGNVIGASVLAGWDSNINGGSSSTSTLDANRLDLTQLDNDPKRLSSSFTQWSVNYALINPTSHTSSQRMLLDYTRTRYTEQESRSHHNFTLGGLLSNQAATKRTTLPMMVQVQAGNNKLQRLTFDLSYQLDLLVWGPLWAGVSIASQPSISFIDSTPTSISDSLGILLTATERGLSHSYQSQYIQLSLAGQEDEHNEWRGMRNRYSLGWEINPNMSIDNQFEHLWKAYKANDLFFVVDETSSKPKRRHDQVITLDSQLNWRVNHWLTSQSQVSFTWQNSNIDAYSRNQFTLSQAFSVLF